MQVENQSGFFRCHGTPKLKAPPLSCSPLSCRIKVGRDLQSLWVHRTHRGCQDGIWQRWVWTLECFLTYPSTLYDRTRAQSGSGVWELPRVLLQKLEELSFKILWEKCFLREVTSGGRVSERFEREACPHTIRECCLHPHFRISLIAFSQGSREGSWGWKHGDQEISPLFFRDIHYPGAFLFISYCLSYLLCICCLGLCF